MRPTRVTASNFGPFADVDLAIPDGAAAILGSNGAGKTTLLAAIEVGLFCAQGELRQYVRHGQDELVLTVEVEHGDALYRIRRGYSSRGSGKTTLDFERREPLIEGLDWGAPPWAPLTCESIDATNKLICATFSLTRETYRVGSLGVDVTPIGAMKPAAAMALFSDHLGLGVYEQLVEHARAEKAGVIRELDRAGGSIDRLADDAARKGEHLAGRNGLAEIVCEHETALAAAEKALAEATAVYQAAKDAQAETETLIVKRDAALAKRDGLQRIVDDGTAAAEELAAERQREAEHAQAAGTVAELQADERKLSAAVAEIKAADERYAAAVRERDLKQRQRDAIDAQKLDLRAKAGTLRGRADKLMLAGPGDETCAVCRQTLGAEALESTLASLRTEADELLAAAQDLEVQADAIEIPDVGDAPAEDPPTDLLDTTRELLGKARVAELELARCRERIENLAQKVAQAEDDDYANALAESRKALAEAEAALDAATSDQPDLAALERNAAARGTLAADARAQLEQARRDQAVAEAALQRAAQAEQDLAAARKSLRHLHARQELLELAEQRYGRNGIPALVLENRVPAIEAEATRILSELGATSLHGARVELRTQRAKKTGGAADTLQVMLVTAAGHDQPYARCSTGERLRVDIALAKAILPATLELMAIDDPSGLDDEGKAALPGVIDWLLTNGLETVFVVSQEAALRDSFEQVVEVVSDGSRSRVLTPDRETVAA